MNVVREGVAGEPNDEDSLAAVLAVLAVVTRDDGTTGAAGSASALSPLARWRARRMAALARTLPEADGVRPSRRRA
jgi:hypothetical protein